MSTNKNWIFIIIVIIVAVIAFIFWGMKDQAGNDLAAPDTFDQSIGNEVIDVKFSSADFGLAINPSQILVESTVPPCDTTLEVGFDYCLYYKGTALEDTNFETAGIRIKERADLTTEDACLNTPPRGYDSSLVPNTLKPQAQVSTSVFSGLSDSGAGHIVTGSLYRLYYKTDPSCYEFETRIANTQLANYPDGTVDEFTDEQRNLLLERFDRILTNVVVGEDLGDVFP